MINKQTEVRFNFFDFWFKPLKNKKQYQSSNKILKKCIDEINTQRIDNGNAIVIDKHEGRTGSDKRNLFVSSAAYILAKKKYKCRIALIRDNKLPVLVNKSTYSLAPMDIFKDQAIAETTNFYIDMNGEVPVVCCEFNNDGPRIADIEYYFRQIARSDLKIASACRAKIHMDTPVNEVLDTIADVLKFEIKARPNRLAYLNSSVNDAFVGNMTALANSVEPQSLKVEAFFRERGKNQNKKKNRLAVGFIKRALKAIQTDTNLTEDFDDFYLEFEKTDGSEGIFNLIKGKVEIPVQCPYKSPGNLDTKKLFDLIEIKFDDYLEKRIK